MVSDRRQGKRKSSGWDVLNVGVFGDGQETAANAVGVQGREEWTWGSSMDGSGGQCGSCGYE